jgi:hypothetical protein
MTKIEKMSGFDKKHHILLTFFPEQSILLIDERSEAVAVLARAWLSE